MIPVNISMVTGMVCNRCKNLLEETYYSCNSFESLLNITALSVRLAQTITKIYRNKILSFVFPRKKEIIVQTMKILFCPSVNI